MKGIVKYVNPAKRSLLNATLLFNPDRYRDTTSKQINIPFLTSDFSKIKFN